MNIQIELENKDRCDGCPLLEAGGRWENGLCRLFKFGVYRGDNSMKHQRPAICIEENGEGGGAVIIEV